MATFSILTQTFDMPATSKVFLESYLERVRSYINKRHLDQNLLDDLSERLSEKLFDASSKEDGIVEKDIIAIVNDLWEPEDIFRDLASEKTQESPRISKEDVKDFFKREFHRNQKDGIILWVCSWLWDTFDVNPIWIRLFFIIFTLTYGAGIIIYLVLWILLPDSSRKTPGTEKAAEKTEKRIKQQAEEFAQDLESRAKTYAKGDESGVSGAIWRLFSLIIRTFVAFFRGIALLVVFVVLISISLSFFFSGIGIIIAGAMSSIQFPIQWQFVFAYIPVWLPWLALLCGVALIGLSIMIASRSIRKPVGSWWFAILCVIILAVGLFWGIQAGMNIAGKYTTKFSKSFNTLSLETISWATITLSDESLIIEDEEFQLWDIRWNDTIEYIPVDTNTLSIETITHLRAPDKATADSLFSKIIPIEAMVQSGTISLTKKDSRDFIENVPMSFLQRELIVKVPKNIIIIPKINEFRDRHTEPSKEITTRKYKKWESKYHETTYLEE